MINKKKICLILAVLVLGACNISYAQEAVNQQTSGLENIKSAKEMYERAEQAMSVKDYQSAIVLLSGYISSKPKKYEAYKLRGECFYALHQFRLAQKDFQAAIDLKADDDKFSTNTKYISAVVLGADKQEQLQNPELGNLYGQLMYAQKALNNPAYETSYAKAQELNSHIYLPKPKKDDITRINCPQKYGKILNPQGVDADISAVIDDIEAGKFNEALYKISPIISNYPKYYVGYYLSGVAHSGMEQYDDAIASFQDALKYNPYDFESYASIGQAYYAKAEKSFSSDDAQKSIEYFQKALKYNPDCNTYHFYIGLNEMLMKDYYSAISSFNSAIKNKSNDYNSMYYKLIAQYMASDYKSAEDGATQLLYKHVSNSNSVLYLRALAKYKQDRGYDALADIEKIHMNLDDIYNADIKTTSEKEKTLPGYLYYLKSEILASKGFGAKADLQKALENPVIAAFALSKPEINLSDTQLANQFDYIRTTFSDLSIKYEYLNPDYKLLVSKTPLEPTKDLASEPKAETVDYVSASLETEPETDTLSQGLASQTLQMQATSAIEAPAETKTQTPAASIDMKATTDPLETLADDTKPSIAQMLASQSLLPSQNKQSEILINKPVEEVPQPQEEIQLTSAENPSELKIETKQQEPALNPVSEPEQSVTEKPLAKEAIEVNEEIALDSSKPIVIEAAEKKNSQDFTIKYEAPKTPEVIVDTPPEKDESESIIIKAETPVSVSEKIVISYADQDKNSAKEAAKESAETKPADEVQTIQPKKPISKIVEKHADVDLQEFDVPKTMPQITNDDEVIVFEAPKTIFNYTVGEPDQEDLAQRLAKIATSQSGNSQKSIIITEPTPEQEAEQNVEAVQEPLEKVASEPEKRISEPSLIVPEITHIPSRKQSQLTETIVASKTSIDPIQELQDALDEIQQREQASQAQDFIEVVEPDTECEVKDVVDTVVPEEKPVKEKKQKVKKERVKKEKVTKEKPVKVEKVPEEVVIPNAQLQTPKTEETEDKTAISSILQSVFNGDDENKVVVEDQNLKELDEVQPLEQQEKPVKTKKIWFKKHKVKEQKEVEPEISDAQKISDETLAPAVTVFEPEEKQSWFSKFKLFKKKEKTELSEVVPTVETTQQEKISVEKPVNSETEKVKRKLFKKRTKVKENVENAADDVSIDTLPELRTEKVQIDEPEIPVSETSQKTEKKKFKLFSRKPKSQEVEISTDNAVQPQTKKEKFSLKKLFSKKSKAETQEVPVADKAEKKVIKQLEK